MSAPSNPVTVGVIANPASGRDIRRLVAGASVFDNAEKGNMVFRLMVGLAAVGVEKVVMMPAASGLFDGLDGNMRANAASERPQVLPEFELIGMKIRHAARDTVHAVDEMCAMRVAAIVVLGGDGTNRIVARHCDKDVPICTLSTGTNNAFPKMQEATVAGIATGLVATEQVEDELALRREKMLRVGLDGDPDADCALVDVAVNSERFIGARALWRPAEISEMVVASASPEAVGLSAIAGLLDPISREAPYGLYVRLSPPERADSVITVPLSPGMMAPIGVDEARRIEPGEIVEFEPRVGSLALDGEREIELGPRSEVEVRLDDGGPLTIKVGEVMQVAAQRGLLNGAL